LPVCPEGQACHAINETFTCHWEDWGRPGVHGDPCSSHYDCGPGHTCIGADAHTECPGSGCCSTLCDHTDPTGDDACAAVDRNQGCEPWYLEGMAPEGYEELGVCALPG
jgi:hypothetical protein